MLKRCHTFTISDIDIRSGGDKQLDDSLMTGTTVTQDNRLQKGGPAEPVDVIDIDPGLDQRIDGLDVAALASGNKRRADIAVDTLQIGTMSKYKPKDFEMAAGTRV